MILRSGKQLIQWDFLEGRNAQNLQKVVERDFYGQLFLDNGNQGIDRNSNPDLGSDRILRCSVKRLDPKILLDPAEEQLDLPAELVELGDRQCRLQKVVC